MNLLNLLNYTHLQNSTRINTKKYISNNTITFKYFSLRLGLGLEFLLMWLGNLIQISFCSAKLFLDSYFLLDLMKTKPLAAKGLLDKISRAESTDLFIFNTLVLIKFIDVLEVKRLKAFVLSYKFVAIHYVLLLLVLLAYLSMSANYSSKKF